MNWERYKDLNFLSEMNEGSNTALVLIHGYGADATDLAGLGPMFGFSQPVDFYFPQGVLEIPIAPMMSGRAWFPIRAEAFPALAQGEVLSEAPTPETRQTILKVCEWLNQLGKNYEKVIIGGFSQGAILTSHAFYQLQFQPAALLLFSGYLVAPGEFPSLPDSLKTPFFQSHGQQDQVLSIKGAKKLNEKLIDLGLAGDWETFHGGHEIPPAVVQKAKSFLKQLGF